ncbi:SpoIIE family protein phosphatase [Streptomyces sp. NPDC001292]|uniref:SpoIIE family protein phosphatase n=1 Tax=Streptomyces sp. NPDC001292 TaxID=3364558 RepID=UPI0036C0BD99
MERHRTEPDAQANQPAERAVAACTATAVIDEHGIVTGWSEGARRLLGYLPSEVMGREAAGLLAENVPEAARKPPADQDRQAGKAVLRHRDGHSVDAELLAHRRIAQDGRAEWLVLSAVPGKPQQDHTDALVNWAFTQSALAQAVFDVDLRSVWANAAMERALGVTENGMRGLRLPEIMMNAAGREAEVAMRLALKSGESQLLEQYLRTPGEDREHAWTVSLFPLKDQNGRMRGVCLTARDTTEQYTARQRLLLLNEASTRIGSTLDMDRTAQELADVAVPRLADFVGVYLLAPLVRGEEPPTGALTGAVLLHCVAHQSVLKGCPEAVLKLGEVTSYPAPSAAAQCLAQGRAVIQETTDSSLADWLAQDPVRAARVREYGFHSIMAVPMRARGTSLGAAMFIRHRRPEPFTPDDVVLAEELMARAAVCIDNARRYSRERGTAVALQRNLLPRKLPQQTALEVASRYLPAGVRAGVGGDWFDVIPLSGRRVALVVGDVVGHGLQASATMGRLRIAVRTLADIDLPPEELLTHLDDLVIRLSDEEGGGNGAEPGAEAATIGATCLYGVYDPVSRHCTLARAGHPLPAVLTPDGKVEFLELPPSPPLGLGSLPFESLEAELPEGSVLFLYTDGLIASCGRDTGECFDILRTALTRPAPSLDALCDTVLADLLPEHPADDVALLVARTRALSGEQVATWDLPPDPAIVARARQNATEQLAAWDLGEAVFITELVVSELVTNAIRYGRPPLRLRLIREAHTLICEVSDASNTVPHLRRARVFDEGGRGLMLVAQLTERWGTRHTRVGKTIWAEQSFLVSPTTAPAPARKQTEGSTK